MIVTLMTMSRTVVIHGGTVMVLTLVTVEIYVVAPQSLSGSLPTLVGANRLLAPMSL